MQDSGIILDQPIMLNGRERIVEVVQQFFPLMIFRAAIREEHRAEVNPDDVGTLNLGAKAVLVAYRAVARWNYEKVPTTILCSTLYVNREGHWMAAFQQQTYYWFNGF
jgi:hypothetical protein